MHVTNQPSDLDFFVDSDYSISLQHGKWLPDIDNAVIDQWRQVNGTGLDASLEIFTEGLFDNREYRLIPNYQFLFLGRITWCHITLHFVTLAVIALVIWPETAYP